MNSVVSERSKNEVFGGQGKSPGAALTPRRFFFFLGGISRFTLPCLTLFFFANQGFLSKGTIACFCAHM